MLICFYYQSFTTRWFDMFAWTCSPRRQQALPAHTHPPRGAGSHHDATGLVEVGRGAPDRRSSFGSFSPLRVTMVLGVEVPQETHWVLRSINGHHVFLHLFIVLIFDTGKLM